MTDDVPLVLGPAPPPAARAPLPASAPSGAVAGEIPLLVEPSQVPGLAADPNPVPESPTDAGLKAVAAGGGTVGGWAVAATAAALVGLWVVQAVVGWATTLGAAHPALGWAVYAAAGVIAAAAAGRAAREARGYFALADVTRLKVRLAVARAGTVTRSEDETLRAEFAARVDALVRAGVLRPDARRAAALAIHGAVGGDWVTRAAGLAFRDADDKVRGLIEREARLVGLSTALSPSGPIDAAVVLWQQARLVRQIAGAYGLRPGAVGTCRLARWVATNMVGVGLTQEAGDLLAAAYGPQLAQAAAGGARAAFDLLRSAGGAVACIEPLTGGLVAAVGAGGRAVSGAVGAAAVPASGALTQGVLAAVLTVRVGLAAQDECLPVPLTAEERTRRGAGVRSVLTGFFRTPAAEAIDVPVGPPEGGAA